MFITKTTNYMNIFLFILSWMILIFLLAMGNNKKVKRNEKHI